jgi:hypothetical protein
MDNLTKAMTGRDAKDAPPCLTRQTEVPDLTFVERIKLNARVSLRWQAKVLACQHRIFPKSGPSVAKPSASYSAWRLRFPRIAEHADASGNTSTTHSIDAPSGAR